MQQLIDIFSALVRFFFGLAENTFILPKWWDTLEDSMRDKIKELIMTGVNPFTFEPDSLFEKLRLLMTVSIILAGQLIKLLK